MMLAFAGLAAFGQQTVIDLTFNADKNDVYVRLDSVKVINQTQGGDTILYYPDTVLSINYVGIPEINNRESPFRIYRNYPNPVTGKTVIEFYVPEKEKVSLMVTDVTGRIVAGAEKVLDKGMQSYRFTPGGANIYLFTANWRGISRSIKILNVPVNSNAEASLEYIGMEISPVTLKKDAAVQEFSFSAGDELLYIGYASMIESGLLDSPEESLAYTFQFASNIPCLAQPQVFYDGKFYNTVQVFS